MDVFLKKGQTQTISFNGTVRTGLFLESKKFLVEGYKEFQREFINTLSIASAGIWGASNLAYYSNGDEIIKDTIRGEPIIPTYFINRILKDNFLLQILEKFKLEAQIDAPPFQKEFSPNTTAENIDDKTELSPASFLISSIEIRMNDFGYGSIIFTGAIRANQYLNIMEFKEVGAGIAPLLNNYHKVFLDTFKTVWDHAPQNILSNAAFVSNLKGNDLRKHYRGRNKAIGYMINAMRVFEVACSTDEEFQVAKKNYIPLLFSQDEKYVTNASIDPNMAIYTGHGNYIVIYNEQKISHWQRSLLARVLRVIDVFYTMFEEITENLIYLNSSVSLDDRNPDPKEIEEKARILVEYRARSEFFRSVYDDYDNHTDPQSLKIWRTVEETWEADDRVYALKNQLSLTKNIHDRLMSDLNYMHSKKIGKFAIIFMVLGSLAIILNLIEFTQNTDKLIVPDNLRLLLLVMMGLIISGFTMRIIKKSEKHLD